MTRMTIHADCGNASKKLLLRNLNIAFAQGDVEGILGHFADDIRWQVIGEAGMAAEKQEQFPTA